MRWRAGAAVVLVGALTGCTPAPEPDPTAAPTADGQVVGAYGDLHVAPDGTMQFCSTDADPGFTGSWRVCDDGVRTEGVDRDAIDASLGTTGTADPGGYRWVGPAEGKRTTEDGTDVYTLFLAGTLDDDTFTVVSVGTADYAIPLEYQELRPGVPGGFLLRLVPQD